MSGPILPWAMNQILSKVMLSQGAELNDCVDLDRAQLCLDCDAISAAPKGYCMRCGSLALLSLARVLNRMSEIEPFSDVLLSAPCFHESPKQRRERRTRALKFEGDV